MTTNQFFFFVGIAILILGSIVRRAIEAKGALYDQMDKIVTLPSPEGEHTVQVHCYMIPLKILGYAFMAFATFRYFSSEEYEICLIYSLITAIFIAIPRVFRPRRNFPMRDKWSIQRDRLAFLRIMSCISILIILMYSWLKSESVSIEGILALVGVLFFELIFTYFEHKTWLNAGFDIKKLEPVEYKKD